MSLSTFLLFTLLLLWLLPAVTLIVVYCCDRLRAVLCLRVWALRAARVRGERGPSAIRTSCTVAGSHLRVPLVIEDEAGGLHRRHWHICLN